MPIYEVEVTRSGSLLIEATDAYEAEEIAYDEVELDDVEAYAREYKPGTGEYVLTSDGDYLKYADLLELEEWIDAIEAAAAVDPNQGVMFDV